MAIVYKHYKLDTKELFYVGIGLKEKRAYSKYSRNDLWKNIVSKHNYYVEIYKKNISYDEAKIIEINLIKKYGRLDLKTGILCNMTDGGDGCFNLSDESKKSISNKLKGNKQSEETKLKKSISCKEAWKDENLRNIQRKRTKELHDSGFYIKYNSVPSKKKGLPFSGDKEKLSNSLKQYYKNNKPHNYIILDKNILKNIEIDCLDNYTENKISKKYNLSRNTVSRIVKENNFNPKRNKKNEIIK